MQEVLAAHEYAAALFYHHKGAMPAAANRLTSMVEQYPLFSQADEALWLLGDSYDRMGDRFEDKSAAAYTRIVRDYPLSPHAQAAKEKLQAMKRPVPEADPVAYARMKYELENRTAPSKINRLLDSFKRNPDTSLAAKGGSPSMTILRPGIPVSVPINAGVATQPGAAGGTGSDVTAAVTNDSKELDTRPDARPLPPGGSAASPAAADQTKPGDATAPVATQQPFATNHPLSEADRKKAQKMMAEKAKRDKKAQAKAIKAAKSAPPQVQPQSTTAPAQPPGQGAPAPPQD